MNKTLVLAMAAALLASAGAAAAPLDPAQPIVLANEHVRFEFEPGSMGLRAMTDRAAVPAKADYLRTCACYRAASAKYLTYGDLLGPVEPQKPVPMAEEDGRLGVFLANDTDKAVAFGFRIDAAEHGIKGARFTLTEITPDGAKPAGKTPGPVVRVQTLAPAAIALLEIASE